MNIVIFIDENTDDVVDIFEVEQNQSEVQIISKYHARNPSQNDISMETKINDIFYIIFDVADIGFEAEVFKSLMYNRHTWGFIRGKVTQLINQGGF